MEGIGQEFLCRRRSEKEGCSISSQFQLDYLSHPTWVLEMVILPPFRGLHFLFPKHQHVAETDLKKRETESRRIRRRHSPIIQMFAHSFPWFLWFQWVLCSSFSIFWWETITFEYKTLKVLKPKLKQSHIPPRLPSAFEWSHYELDEGELTDLVFSVFTFIAYHAEG